MKTVSLTRIFLNAGMLVGLCFAIAATAAYFLWSETRGRAELSLAAAMYGLLLGLAMMCALGAMIRLYRVVTAAVRHDVLSLTRMFRDVNDGHLRPSYPLALREFADTLVYLRDSGRKLVREKERLQNLGLIDHLSQLSNRRYLERKLAHLYEARKTKGPSTVLLIDLDQFKSVNDQHGHDAGDLLIVNFAKALRACVRQTDFLARLGGDEFCVIYPYTALDKAAGYVERLRRQLPRHIPLTHGVQHALRWTGGVSVIADRDAKFDDVLWRADKALIQAKEAGRNNTKIFDDKPRLHAVPRVLTK